MPTIEVDYRDLEEMLGTELHGDLDRLNDLLGFAKGEVKFFDEEEGLMNVEIKDSNRPDMWNVEGLARTLRSFLGLEKGLKAYTVDKPLVEVNVDPRLKGIRSYIGCSTVKNVELTDTVIRGLMHLQDKLDQSYGRNRQRTSIGLYDFSLITQPLQYTVADPTEISFVPLGSEDRMNLKQILERHPKGLEYGHIVKKHPVYPILLDSEGKVLSFPPIVNSNDLGRVTEQTRHVLVEVTGTMHETVLNALKIVTLSLIDRGGRAYSATIHYPHEELEVVTPKLDTWPIDLEVNYVNSVLGFKLTTEQIAELLGKAGFGSRILARGKVKVQVPCYRIDVMHQVDLVEDIAIAFGYNNIKPLWRRLPTRGGVNPEGRLVDLARELMVGEGFQEILTYSLTNVENLFKKMNCRKERIVEISNPKVQTLTCLRSWLLPGLMGLLSSNLHVEYPQKIFELGPVTLLDRTRQTRTRDEKRLAAAVVHAKASFSEIKSVLDAFCMNFGLEWQIREASHPSFIEGRVGSVTIKGRDVGIIGEIHPKVLEAWKIENPVAAFELNIDEILKLKHSSGTR